MIVEAGNVGIGTVNPETKLHVNGKIKATEIETDNNLKINGGFIVGDPKVFEVKSNGHVYAYEVRVRSEIWPDYVFEKNYQLPSLYEIETYINKNGRLPQMPAAGEVIKNGYSINEINVKLLQKIEELTLYTIEQEKRIKELEEQNIEIEEIKTEIENLKKN